MTKTSNKEIVDLLDIAPDMVCVANTKGYFVYLNKAWEKALGFTLDELYSNSLFHFIHPDDHQKTKIEIEKQLDGKMTQAFENRYLCKNGSYKIFEWNATSAKNGKLYATARDVTNQRKIEERLRKQNLYIQTVIDNLPIGLAVHRLDGGTAIYMNRKFEEIYGWPDEELVDVGVFFEKVYPDPAYREQIKARVMNDIASQDPSRMRWEDIEATGKSGDKKIITAMNIPLFEENIMISTVQDITDRKKWDTALQESEQRYRSLVENTLDGYFICELHSGRFVFLNQRICELFQYSIQEGLSLAFWDVIDPGEHQIIKNRIRSRMERNVWSFSSNVYLARRRDGSRFRAEISSSLVTYQGKSVLQGVLRDVTEEEKFQHQLQQAQKREAIGTLAGGIAHDFNNILSAIIGYTEMTRQELPHPSTGSEYLGRVLEASQRAKNLVKQILAFSRQTEHEERPFQVDLILKEALQMIRSSLPSSVEIHRDIEHGLPEVLGDPTQIYQVIMNLCMNASQAMEEGHGTIEVTLHQERFDLGDAARSMGLVPGDYVCLTIRDTGRGMPTEVMERVFDPYFTTKQAGEGSGLGLAVVYGIVKRHGGNITVHSEPGQGSTFSVYLPAAEAETGLPGQEGPDESPLPQGRERILFVDDEAAIAELGRQYLERLGYDVTTTRSSIEALQMFRGEPDRFDLILTDMTMPGMTGDQLAVQLLSIRPDLPIILCTGYSKRISEHRARRLGIRAFLMKPLTHHELAVTVRRVLDAQPPSAAPA